MNCVPRNHPSAAVTATTGAQDRRAIGPRTGGGGGADTGGGVT